MALTYIKVICAILEQDGRVLVTQRSAGMSQPLLWEFPGGKVEANETEEAALVREIQEELHLQVVPLQRLTPVLHAYADKRIQLIPFICRYVAGTIHLMEHQAYQWSTPAELTRYNWCPADAPVVAEYRRIKGIQAQ